MKNKKGFTLIELLAVVIIIGLLVIIAFPAVSKYLIDTKNDTYSLHEAELKSATANMMSKCIEGNVEDCVPDNGESRTVYLNELIAQKFSTPLKDPANTNNYCSSSDTYVVVTNSTNNVVNLDYQVCLVCSEYKSPICETVKPNDTCDKETDPERPVCGEAVGSSTVWTNADRIVSIGCSDTGCGCTQGTFYKRFEENAKQGVITVVDKAGNYTDCVVDVYVDKEVPTCSLTVEGNLGENGWYGGTAPVVKLTYNNADISGIATYGMGVSSKNYDLNKKTSYTVSSGITTVYGYVKDNAGNVGICSVPVKYDPVVPTGEITYGYQVYPKSDIATVDGRNIKLNHFISEYGNVLGANIYLKSNTSGMSVTIYRGSTEIAKRTISAGVTFMKFSFTGNYDGLTIDMGSSGNISLIERIELITDQTTNGFYTNKDVIVYATSKDSFSGKGYYSFDGSAWQTSNAYTYGSNVVGSNAKIKDFAGNSSDPITFDITNIDKEVPSCTITTDFEPNGKNGWFTKNFGLTLHPTDLGVSKVRDHNITTNSNPSYTTTLKGTQTTDTKLTTWHGYVRDKAGNVNRCSIDVKLDKVDPICTLSSDGTKGDNDWYISDVVISYTTYDATSDIAFKDLTDVIEHSVAGETKITMDFDTTSKTYYCHVEDASGRTGYNTITEKRDTVKPTCTIDVRDPDGDNGWYKTNVDLSFSTSDATSGVFGYDFINSTTIDYTKKRTVASVTSSTKGVTYYGYAKDNAGHTNDCKVIIKVDKDDPYCSIEDTGTMGNANWYVGNIRFALSDSDASDTSGIIERGISSVNSVDYNGETSISHTADGTGIIYYGFVRDESGRTGTCTSETEKKDSTAPEVCSINITSGTLGSNGWYISNVGLSLNDTTPDDDESGVVAYNITSGTPDYSKKSATALVTADSTSSDGTVYTAYIMDEAGNVRTCDKIVKKDTKVDCYLQLSGTPGLNGWYRSAVTVTLKPVEEVSGLAAKGMNRSYSVDYNGNTSLSKSGYSTYQFFYGYVKDNAGNTNYCNTYIRGIDPDPPSCTIDVDGTMGENDWYVSSKVTLTGSVSDSGSGVMSSGLNTSSSASFTDGLEVVRYGNTTSEGVTYYCHVRDKAGNVTTVEKTIKKDSSVPNCYFDLDGTLGLNSYYTSNVKVSVDFYDGYSYGGVTIGSGVQSKALNQSSTTSYTNMSGVTVSGNTHSITHKDDTSGTTYYCYVKDNAGNVKYRSKTVKKDETNPSCSLSANGTTTDVTFTSNTEITVSVTGSDSTSGVLKSGVSKYAIPDYSTTSVSFNHDTYNRMTFYGYVMDKAGNSSVCDLDVGRRSKNDSCTITPSKSPDGENGWYKTDVDVTYTAYNYNNGVFGIGAKGYEVDSTNTNRMMFKRQKYPGGSETDVSLFSVTHSSNGSYLYTGRYNETGFLESLGYDDAYCYLMINKDSVKPTIEITDIYGTADNPAKETAYVTIKATESGGSGIAYWYYQYSSGGTWYKKTDSYGVSEYKFEYSYNGKIVRNYKVCDVAGNCSDPLSATVYRASCSYAPSTATLIEGTCTPACGESTKKDTLTWTTSYGAVCSVEQEETTCHDYSECGNTVNKVCKNNSATDLFGSSIGSIRYGNSSSNYVNNYGAFYQTSLGPYACSKCPDVLTVSGYDRICVTSACTDEYLFWSAAAMVTEAENEYREGISDKNYCAEKFGSDRFWCSCEIGKSVSFNGGYVFYPFAHEVLSLEDKCSWLTSYESELLRPTDACYQT